MKIFTAAAWAITASLTLAQPHGTQEAPKGNLMALEQSPYLKQHANDPVEWKPWGEAAFEQAKKEDKPVFLSVGYAACHWCHVMQRKCFQNEKIAKFLNENFVCIKLDREERPDIDRIYMEACQAMNNGRGGWPLSGFLAPDKRPLFVGTYFAPDRFTAFTNNVAKAWKDKAGRKDLFERISRFEKFLKDSQRRGATEDLPDPERLEDAAANIRKQEDPRWGGFGWPPDFKPKFPGPSKPMFLLRDSVRTGDVKELGAPVRRMLDALIRGGIRDHLAGGFHRYSTDREWKLPHFEKMLYDQALLAQLFLEGWQIWKDPRYERTVRETLDWCLADMQAKTGGFISAYDADADHEEGKTYVWTLDELKTLLTRDEAVVTIARCKATEEGNWREESAPDHPTHSNILYAEQTFEQVAEQTGKSEEEVKALLASARAKLLVARADHAQPLADTKVLTGWNALMISALADAGAALNEPKYLEAATRTVDVLDTHLRQKDGRYLRSFAGGKARHPGELFDHAALLVAFLDLHEATLDPKWLTRARDLVPVMDREFKAEDGGFVDSRAKDLIYETRATFDGATPSGSSLAVVGLVRLAVMTADEAITKRSHEVLKAMNRELTRAPHLSPHALMGLDLIHFPALKVELHGEGGEPLLKGLRTGFHPYAMLTRKADTTGEPFVLVCVGETCLEPARTRDEVMARVKQALNFK